MTSCSYCGTSLADETIYKHEDRPICARCNDQILTPKPNSPNPTRKLNLVACPDCGKLMSRSRGARCPNCGRQKNRHIALAIILLAIILIALFASFH